MANMEKRQVEEWNDMENMEDFCVSQNYTQRDHLLLPPSSSSSSSSLIIGNCTFTAILFHNYIIYFNNYISYKSLPPPPPL
jgi:hypothetical protein